MHAVRHTEIPERESSGREQERDREELEKSERREDEKRETAVHVWDVGCGMWLRTGG
jgi:hypothetical protein